MGLYRTVRIISITPATGAAKTFCLVPADDTPLYYRPGQFLTFVFSKPGGEDRRSYSISSTPALDEPLSITVKRLENGAYSRKLFDYAQVGDLLTTTGAAGFFVLPEDMHLYKAFFFMAAGSGITPVYPLIKTLLYQYPHTRVVLIYSNRSAITTLFYDELLQLLQLFAGRLVIEFLFSSAVNLARARLGKGLLQELVKQYSRAPLAETLFYTCGPFDYMRMVTIVLLENSGCRLQHIKKENFTTLKIMSAAKTQPPDIKSASCSYSTTGADFRWQLQTQLSTKHTGSGKKSRYCAALQLRVQDSCGSCAATCTKGMRMDELIMKY